MSPIPNTVREQFLELLHQVIQHSPLKLEETNGTDYDKGYIAYQNMVISDVKELETTMWDFWQAKLDEAVKAERERFVEILEENKRETYWGTDDDNEVAEVTLNNYVLSVKEALTTPTETLPNSTKEV